MFKNGTRIGTVDEYGTIYLYTTPLLVYTYLNEKSEKPENGFTRLKLENINFSNLNSKYDEFKRKEILFKTNDDRIVIIDISLSSESAYIANINMLEDHRDVNKRKFEYINFTEITDGFNFIVDELGEDPEELDEFITKHFNSVYIELKLDRNSRHIYLETDHERDTYIYNRTKRYYLSFGERNGEYEVSFPGFEVTGTDSIEESFREYVLAEFEKLIEKGSIQKLTNGYVFNDKYYEDLDEIMSALEDL